MQEQEPRTRGAQPGNTNALKHGFYSRALDRLSREDLTQARALDATDLSEEIALQRARLLRLLAREKYKTDDYDMLVRVTGQITRSVIAHFAMRGGAADRLIDATNTVLDDMRALLRVTELAEQAEL